MPRYKSDITALHNMLEQIRLLVASDPIPPGGRERLEELLDTALKLTEALKAEPTRKNPAASLGKRGGLRTAERGPEYFRKIAAMRKTRAGGRPKEPLP